MQLFQNRYKRGLVSGDFHYLPPTERLLGRYAEDNPSNVAMLALTLRPLLQCAWVLLISRA